MKKRFITTFAGVCLLSMLASCTPTVYEDVTLPKDDPTSPITIKFWHCLGHDKAENLDKIVSDFNATYKGKYEVVAEKVAGGYDELHDNIKTKLAANEVPALAMGYPDSFSEYITSNINESTIVRADTFMDDPEFGYTQAQKDDFVDQFLAEGQNYQFEGTWSLPMYKSTEIMYYNENYFSGDNPQTINKFKNNAEYISKLKDVSDLASKVTSVELKALKDWCKENGGYTYEVPVKWDDMFSTSREMLADLKTEGLDKNEFYPVGYDSDANMFISQFAQRGIPYTVNNEETSVDPSKHFAFNTPEAKNVLEEVTGLVNDKLLITKGTLGGAKYTNEYFGQGKLAMSIGSTGGSSYQISSNFKVSLAAVPYSGDTPKYIMQGPSICFFNNGDPYYAKGAWLFYKEMSDPTNNAELALENSYDPIMESSYETESYKSFVAKHDLGLNYNIPYYTQQIKQYYMTSPVFIGSSTARGEMDKLLQYVIASKMSVDSAFEAAINACNMAV